MARQSVTVPAKHGVQAQAELPIPDRLHDEVVGPELERDHPVDFGELRGHENDEGIASPIGASHAAKELGSAHVGGLVIDENRRGTTTARPFHRSFRGSGSFETDVLV
jgi:hypothetical protein